MLSPAEPTALALHEAIDGFEMATKLFEVRDYDSANTMSKRVPAAAPADPPPSKAPASIEGAGVEF